MPAVQSVHFVSVVFSAEPWKDRRKPFLHMWETKPGRREGWAGIIHAFECVCVHAFVCVVGLNES